MLKYLDKTGLVAQLSGFKWDGKGLIKQTTARVQTINTIYV